MLLDCVPFSNDFGSGDLTTNGFAEITGEVALASAAGKDGGGGLLAAGTSFASIEVSFDVFVGRPPGGVRLIAGCMLYARGDRNASGTHNQARFELDPMAVRLEHEVRVAEGSEGTESTDVGPALPIQDSWHRATLVLRKVGPLVEAAASFDGAPPNRATPLPMAVPDPRVVSVKCGIPYAEKSTMEQVSLKVAVDNLQGRVCTTERRSSGGAAPLASRASPAIRPTRPASPSAIGAARRGARLGLAGLRRGDLQTFPGPRLPGGRREILGPSMRWSKYPAEAGPASPQALRGARGLRPSDFRWRKCALVWLTVVPHFSTSPARVALPSANRRFAPRGAPRSREAAGEAGVVPRLGGSSMRSTAIAEFKAPPGAAEPPPARDPVRRRTRYPARRVRESGGDAA